MNRKIKSFEINTNKFFKDKLFKWLELKDISVCLNSNDYLDRVGDIESIVAAEAQSKLPYTNSDSLHKLDNYIKNTKDWIFGYLSYDLKNEIEDLVSKNKSSFNLPNLFFFQPKKIWIIKKDKIEAHYIDENQIDLDFKIIKSIDLSQKNKTCKKIQISPKLNKKEYENKIKKILSHITRGDIYEANFCMEWFAQDSDINPILIYDKLNALSKSPMSAFFRNNDFYLLSSSPERFLKKNGDKLIIQPIKGTSRRDIDLKKDNIFKDRLKSDPKERSENIMIVDLTRNDLSKISKSGTVRVTELCKVYPFKQVHQMISTVESELKDKTSFIDVIKSTFPMGSMTGAPKIKALKIIDELEISKREIYSGALGYIDPKGNCDFNVIIRSLIYDSRKHQVSFQVGSAITSNSDPSKEYEECLLKAKPMLSVLQ